MAKKTKLAQHIEDCCSLAFKLKPSAWGPLLNSVSKPLSGLSQEPFFIASSEGATLSARAISQPNELATFNVQPNSAYSEARYWEWRQYCDPWVGLTGHHVWAAHPAPVPIWAEQPRCNSRGGNESQRSRRKHVGVLSPSSNLTAWLLVDF